MRRGAGTRVTLAPRLSLGRKSADHHRGSTGLNWAIDITAVEQDRANDGNGSQLMHFFAPEITFANPDHPNVELVFRMHHRSGVFGLVSDAWGGAQYGTVGLRLRF
jgi:hypothetical protein